MSLGIRNKVTVYWIIYEPKIDNVLKSTQYHFIWIKFYFIRNILAEYFKGKSHCGRVIITIYM